MTTRYKGIVKKRKKSAICNSEYSMVVNHLDFGEYLGETLREERSEFNRVVHFILSASLLRHEN